ncbi:hypothetical protein E1262_24780 [Jiangella aurantiaca]|uniref:Uncharacterized protein n=1 Tax=Jiangella aurantiaca TaxID=2530373 RepID=A0A4R5A4F0_9ACTN|nr:hypothetical protein [Jiangella aurantiaca]TDD65529.1 hypothetical protein E1262_24780 [Jiangella aurantiaca]
MQLENRPPSAHRRALIIWLAIYPLVTLGQLLLRPLIGDLPIPVSTLVLTLLVVPVAVYLVVPALTRANVRLSAARSRRVRPARS